MVKMRNRRRGRLRIIEKRKFRTLILVKEQLEKGRSCEEGQGNERYFEISQQPRKCRRRLQQACKLTDKP
jgi:hypothetical protein